MTVVNVTTLTKQNILRAESIGRRYVLSDSSSLHHKKRKSGSFLDFHRNNASGPQRTVSEDGLQFQFSRLTVACRFHKYM